MLDKKRVLEVLGDVSRLPVVRLRDGRPNRRMIYEGGDARGKGSGQFYIDYASFPGGSTEEVPLSVIEELEREGKIVPAFPDNPKAKAWELRTVEGMEARK